MRSVFNTTEFLIFRNSLLEMNGEASSFFKRNAFDLETLAKEAFDDSATFRERIPFLCHL